MNFRSIAVIAVLAAAVLPGRAVYAETAPVTAATDASTSWDKEKLKDELEALEAEVERVRRTQGEAGLRRKGLIQKLAREKAMTEFHLQLIERLERIEQRLNQAETRASAR